MRAFGYARAATADDAIDAGATGARFIAGGTNLLDLMKVDVERPDRLVDIGRLPFTKVEDQADGGVRIGALVPNSDLAAHPRIRRAYPLLSRALLAGASGQLRNKATTGGNLLQRTRCYYFYDRALPCNKRDPGSGCGAIGGFNRIHAILGASDQCIATHPSDMAVAMLALDARIEVRGSDGTRTIPLAELHRLPGDTPHIDTNLAPGDLIEAVTLPPPPGGTQVYRKVRDRASYAFALVSIAAALTVEQGVIARAALAFGGLAHRPWRDPAVEQALVGERPSTAAFNRAADLLLAEARGQGHNDFKIDLARRTLVAVLREAAGAPQ